MSVGKGWAAIAEFVLRVCCFTVTGVAQGKQLTDADYARGEKFMAYNVNPLVYHTVYHPSWLADGRFWYQDRAPDGVTFILVDPAKGTKAPAFDHAKLAAALTAASIQQHHLRRASIPSRSQTSRWPTETRQSSSR